eukprot:scaffold13869_cov122-Isochrysis_galbana.AAC.3
MDGQAARPLSAVIWIVVGYYCKLEAVGALPQVPRWRAPGPPSPKRGSIGLVHARTQRRASELRACFIEERRQLPAPAPQTTPHAHTKSRPHETISLLASRSAALAVAARVSLSLSLVCSQLSARLLCLQLTAQAWVGGGTWAFWAPISLEERVSRPAGRRR